VEDLLQLHGEAQQILADFTGSAKNAFNSRTLMEKALWADYQEKAEDVQRRMDDVSYFLWSIGPWSNFTSDELPSTTEELKEINLSACVDEYESAALLITNFSTRDFASRIHVSDLIADLGPAGAGPAGAGVEPLPQQLTASSSHIVLRNVMFHPLREGRVIADPLPRANEVGQVNVPEGQTGQIWLTVDTFDLRPGNYQSILTFKPEDTSFPTKTVALNLTVLPIRLPEQMPIAVYNWDYATATGYIRDLLDHRMNRLLVSTYICLPECDKTGSVIKIDYTEHDKTLLLKSQFGTEIIYSYGVVYGFDLYVASKFKWEFMGDPWQKAFRTWFLDWLEHIKRMGFDYDDFSMQIWDEAGGETVDKVVQVGPLLRELDPKVRWIMDGAQNLEEAQRMDPYVDIWIPHLPRLNSLAGKEQLLAFYKRTGKPVWIYTCRVQMTGQPVLEYYRLKPWWTWKLGLDGVCFWAYNSWRGDPWDDFDITGREGYSDNGVVYSGDMGAITTRRWEAWREGLEDYLYLYLCEGAVNEIEKSGEKVEAGKIRQRMDEIVDVMLSNPEDVEALEKYRREISSTIVSLHKTRERIIKAPPQVQMTDNTAKVEWQCARRVRSQVFWRQKQAPQWRKNNSVDAVTQVEIRLPDVRPHLVYEFYALSTDELGQVEATEIKEFGGIQ